MISMHRLARTAAIASAAVLSVGPLAAQAAEHLTVVERPTHETTVNKVAKSDSIGDLLVFDNPVFDAANKTQVGSDQGYCVRIEVGKTWECSWTNLLKDGMITVEGPFFDTGDSSFVVTGGSGKYAGAKGSMKLHWRDAKGSAYDFNFDLQ